MALVLQKVGSAQGLANPVLYQLAATQNNTTCNSSTVANGNSCLFYDTTAGNNTTPCNAGSPNCVTGTNGDTLGVLSGYSAAAGYDLTTGLGSMNVSNLVNAWATLVGTSLPTITVSPATLTAGQVSVAYSQQFTASGGTEPYTFTALGNLPPGLTLNSATGVLSGSPTAANTYNFTIMATDSSAAGPYSGQLAYVLNVYQSGAVPTIVWNPSTLQTGKGNALGTGVLDATSTTPGSFSYTIPLDSQTQPVTASTVLPVGTYTITATFTPANPVLNTTASASITFKVIAESVFVANSNGSVSGLDAGGNAFSSAVSGGGLTIGIGSYGSISSVSLSGSTENIFNDSGGTLATIPGASGGLSSPTGQVVDAQGYQWFANSNNSVSGFGYDGYPVSSPSTGFTGGLMSSPGGIAVDAKGSLWISNTGNNSVTEIIGVANPSPPVVQLVKSPPQ